MKFGFLDSLNVTVISMSIVFILLTFLMVVINLQSYLLKERKKKSVSDKVQSQPIEEEVVYEEEVNDNELEVVAAIMATLSTYMDVPQDKLAIKSIKRINGSNSNWSNASMRK